MSADRRDHAPVLAALLLVLASAVYFASYARVGLYDDEGYLLEGVTRLLDGQVIYRDFHHTYAPGRFYLFAGLFRLLGENLLVVRGTWVVLRTAVVLLAWLFARRLLCGPLVWAPPLALLAAPGPWHKSFFHLFLVAGLLVASDLFRRGGARAAALAGAFVALAILFRQDVGVVVGAAIVSYAILGRILPAPGAPRIPWARAAAGFAAVMAPPMAYFASVGALAPLVTKVFFAGVEDNRANELPFPPLLPFLPGGAPGAGAAFAVIFVKVLYWAPPITFLAFGAALSARALRQRRRPEPERYFLLLLGGTALAQVWARSDVSHLFQAIGLVYFAWALAAQAGLGGLAPRDRAAAGWALAFILPVALTAGIGALAGALRDGGGAEFMTRAGIVPTPENASGALAAVAGVRREPLGVPRARGILVPPAEGAVVREAGRVLDETTKPGDYVLTLPGYQLLYFLFDRRNPTPYPHVRRAFDSPDEERRYIEQIEAHGTPMIFFQDFAIDGRPERRFAVYARGVMEWITTHYKPVKEISSPGTGLRFVVLQRLPGGS